MVFSILTIPVLFLLLVGLPAAALGRYVLTPLSVRILAVLGLYAFLSYLKPASLSWGCIPACLLLLGFLLKKEKFQKPGPAVLCILAYAFLLFLFRWEPPGSDPVKWGSYARLMQENGALPGNTWPLSEVETIKGINLGVPILISFLRIGDWVPWERVVNFSECLSLALFVFLFSLSLENWFSRSVSQWTAFLSLALFTNPQQYLAWGGTPTLLGMCSGFLLLHLVKRIDALSFSQIILYAFALAFTVHAHPLGVYVSLLVCLPIAALLLWGNVNAKRLKNIATLAGTSLFFFSPFFLLWGNQVSDAELKGVWEWQQKMAPYLFRAGNGIYNLYTQLGAYLWSTAFLLTSALTLVSIGIEKDLKKLLCFFLPMGMIFFCLENVRHWWMPLSFLVYPERVATMAILPLALGTGWLVTRVRRWNWYASILVVVCLLCVRQLSTRIVPLLFHSRITEADRIAMQELPKYVSPSDCVKIDFESAGLWIPVLSLRCTIPYHVLSESVQDEQRKNLQRPLRWRFFANGTPANEPGTIVLSNGATLVRLQD